MVAKLPCRVDAFVCPLTVGPLLSVACVTLLNPHRLAEGELDFPVGGQSKVGYARPGSDNLTYCFEAQAGRATKDYQGALVVVFTRWREFSKTKLQVRCRSSLCVFGGGVCGGVCAAGCFSFSCCAWPCPCLCMHGAFNNTKAQVCMCLGGVQAYAAPRA